MLLKPSVNCSQDGMGQKSGVLPGLRIMAVRKQIERQDSYARVWGMCYKYHLAPGVGLYVSLAQRSIRVSFPIKAKDVVLPIPCNDGRGRVWPSAIPQLESPSGKMLFSPDHSIE